VLPLYVFPSVPFWFPCSQPELPLVSCFYVVTQYSDYNTQHKSSEFICYSFYGIRVMPLNLKMATMRFLVSVSIDQRLENFAQWFYPPSTGQG